MLTKKKFPPLYITVDRNILNMLVIESKSNFFNFLYDKTDYYFFKEDESFISKYILKKYIKLDKEEAQIIYDTNGFEDIVNLTQNLSYKELFNSYEIMLHLNKTKDFYIPISDLELLMAIADITLDKLRYYEKN